MDEQKYGVSFWEDPDKIYRELHELTSKPIYEVNPEELKRILEYFDTKCAGSKKISTEAKNYIPGGVQHNLAFNYPFPIAVAKAEGAYMWDVDGNKYIDFLQAGGPTILGSNYPSIRAEIKKLLDECGPVTGLLHEAELLLAKELGNRVGHGGAQDCQDRDQEKENHQGRRRIPRLVRSDGLRTEDSRNQTVPRKLRYPRQLL